MRSPKVLPGSGLAETRDASDLARIHRQRDPQALHSFFERHQQAAYGLALRLTRSPQEAEEILQDALLTVWERAATFRREGSAGSWFQRIVALQALQRLRSLRRRVLLERHTVQTAPQRHPGPEASERGEVLKTLALALQKLPADDRLLLDLRFGAGLRVAEIARSVGIPRQTVTSRLERALQTLRGMLRKDVLDSFPTLLPQHLAAHLTTGVPLPEGLAQRLMARLGREVANRPGAPSPLGAAAPAQRLTAGLYWAGSLLLATGLAASLSQLEWAGPRESRATLLVPASVHSSAPTACASAPSSGGLAAPPFSYCWPFSQRDFVEFSRGGPWRYERGAEGLPGALIAPSGTLWAVTLPPRVPTVPMLLEVDFQALPAQSIPERSAAPGSDRNRQEWVCGAFWPASAGTEAPRVWQNVEPLSYGKRHLFQAYFLGRHVVGQYDRNWIHHLIEYQAPPSGSRLQLRLKNLRVTCIRLRSLAGTEIPSSLNDPPALAAALRRAQ